MAIVCLCRGTRSGGKAVAQCLATRLGFPLIGREVAQEAAARLGVPAELLAAKMSDRPSVWSRFSSMRRAYIVAVRAALAEHAASGNLVYHGLAGGMLLRGLPNVFCVRLIAPMEVRVRAVMGESDMDADTAEQYIRDIDESRARWVKVMYGEDIMDPSLYDLVINLESLSAEGGCSVIARALHQPELDVTERAVRRLSDFITTCRVELALAADAELRPLDLGAESERGKVVIRGTAPLHRNGRTESRIIQLAGAVPGVEEVLLNVEWFDPYP